MNHITLNDIERYFENTLEENEMIVVESHIKQCSECAEEIRVLKLVDEKLRSITQLKSSDTFIPKVFNLIQETDKIFHKDFKFVMTIIGLFFISLTSILLYLLFLSNSTQIQKPEVLNFLTSFRSLSEYFQKVFSGSLGIPIYKMFSLAAFSIVSFLIYLIIDKKRELRHFL